MFKTIAISILQKVGTDILISLCESALKALKDRKDNSVCSEDVERIVAVKNERLGNGK